MAVLNEIAAKLAALGVGTVGTTLHIGMMPETPDVCCAVYEYPGRAPTYQFGTVGIDLETPAIQVVCRGAAYDYATPRASATLAYEGLAAVECTTLTSTSGGTSALYHWIHPSQSQFVMRRDDSNRVYIGFNCLCEKELSST